MSQGWVHSSKKVREIKGQGIQETKHSQVTHIEVKSQNVQTLGRSQKLIRELRFINKGWIHQEAKCLDS